MAWTGARPSELFALRWRDVDFERNEIHISKARVRGTESTPKTKGSNRRIPLFRPARAALELQKPISYSDEHQYVFTRADHGPYNSKNMDLRWKQACIRAGVRPRPNYHLRHTFASQLLASGEQPGETARTFDVRDDLQALWAVHKELKRRTKD
jgi:integrase